MTYKEQEKDFGVSLQEPQLIMDFVSKNKRERRMENKACKVVSLYKMLKTCDYGVPSIRQRLIIIGLRKDLGYFDFNMLDQIVTEYDIPNEKKNPSFQDKQNYFGR
jgi:site-specific DNA-cytosine methylase